MSLAGPSRTWNAGVLPVLLACAFAVMAAVAFISIFLIGKLGAVVIVGAALFAVLFVITSNQRLLCLWGAVLTAPFPIAKHFWMIPHMGGAGSFTIEPVDIFLVLLLGFIIRDRAVGIRHKLRWSPVAFCWGGLILVGLYSVAAGPLRAVAAHEVLRMAKCYLLFFVVLNEALRVRQMMHVVAALVVVMAMQSGVAFLQGMLRTDLGLQMLGEASQETIEYAQRATYAGGGDAGFRVNGLLGHPNLLAGYLALLLPICLALLFTRISSFYKLILAGVTGLSAVALLLTLSRTGWLSFGVAFVVLFGLSFAHPRLRTRFLFARLAVLGGIGLAVAAFSGRILQRLFQSDPGALNFRYEWNEVAWQMVKDHPIAGIGLNSFVFHLPGRTKYGGVEGLTERFGEQWPAAHNIYLLTWAEQGTIAFILFIGLHLYLLYIGFKNANRYVNDVMFAVNLGCLAGFISLMIDGMSSFYIRNPAPARVFWIVAGLMVAVDYWNRANRPHQAGYRVVNTNPADAARGDLRPGPA